MPNDNVPSSISTRYIFLRSQRRQVDIALHNFLFPSILLLIITDSPYEMLSKQVISALLAFTLISIHTGASREVYIYLNLTPASNSAYYSCPSKWSA